MMTNQTLYHAHIEACVEAMNACNLSYVANLKEYNLEKLGEYIRITRECAEICSFTAQSLSQGSQFAGEIAELCAKVCEACIHECSKHDNAHSRECMEACRRCIHMCRDLMVAVA
jgi:hypothetical protein